MNQLPSVRKASGELQPFEVSKLENSLLRSGANEELIKDITTDIVEWMEEGTSTKQIYTRAFRLLHKKRRSMAARYSLKKAIMALGPSGYPFEHFVGHIFRCKGFEVKVGQVVEGKCVTHEVDVIASGNLSQHLVECKYHNSQGKCSSIQVPLYIRSRVDDIIATRKSLPQYKNFTFHGWIVTNTRFTTDAMQYGRCCGLNLMSWDYPKNDSLKALIEKYKAFPITTLTQLTKAHKQHLLKEGIVLCSELLETPQILSSLELRRTNLRKVMEELNDLCDGQ
jgi:hypothetical protein